MTNRREFLITAASALGVSMVAMPALAKESGRKGTFTGKSDHITTGHVNVVKKDGGYVVELGKDFSLDGAPDPRVGLGKDGKYDAATDAGALKELAGAQNYALPEGVDAKGYNEVYIWCRKFNVPLGVATLN